MNLISKVFGWDNEFFDETGKPKYMDANYFKNLSYKYIKEREKVRRHKGKCIMPGCDKKCVASHTIPEASVLKRIASAGAVFYPKYNADIGAYECVSISTKKASVFPGFCDEHENWFSGFELSGDFKHPSMAIQNLRIICRYLFHWNSILKVFEQTLQNYRSSLFNYNNEKIGLVNLILDDPINLIAIEDENTDRMQQQIGLIKSEIVRIKNNDLLPFIRSMEGDVDYVSIFVIDINIALPVCLAGKSDFGNDNEKYTVHLSIFPHANGTFCCFSINVNFKEQFLSILDKYNDDADFVRFIESWMIYGTDQWYINPEEWQSYSTLKKARILDELQITKYFPDRNLEFTVFDAAREKSLRK